MVKKSRQAVKTGTEEVAEPFGSRCGQKVLWKSRERNSVSLLIDVIG